MIVARGYTGGVAVVRRHLRTIRPSKQPEAFFRRTVLAREETQVDGASFGTIRIGNTTRALVLCDGALLLTRDARALSARHEHGELSALPSGRLCLVWWNASPRARRQPQDGRARPRERHSLPSEALGNRGPLPLRADALCGRARQREGSRRALHSLSAWVVFRGAVLSRFERSQ